jgi:YD repeat-containing protein
MAPLKASLPNAFITSYTYKPLVGMTSQTDAKGMTTYYEYDAFQRLKAVKDQNGNILKQTDYHYKN